MREYARKLGLCEKCKAPTEAAYEIRNNKVYLAKFCKTCGRTSSMVSKDAIKWLWKRSITGYTEPVAPNCSIDCSTCNHHKYTSPTTVSIDVTNICNQKCPICLAYVDAMGYTFHPPMEYFDKIFLKFKDSNPKPNICFFGGEPTMHREFLEIVRLAKSYGFQVQLFSNGLKLADKKYCKELCELGVQVNLGLDGTKNEIYKTLRGDNSLNAKKKAFENLIECGVNKLVVISTIAEGVNDDNMMEVLDFIHEHKEHVSTWAFVPLTPCWEGTSVKLDPTTTECVERIFESKINGAEFVPTAMMSFQILSRFFGKQTLGGAHPNCESATIVVSDGEKYRPISHYMKKKLSSFLVELRYLDEDLTAKDSKIPSKGLRRKIFQLETIARLCLLIAQSVDLKRFFGESALKNGAAFLKDLIKGRKMDAILADRTAFKHILTMMTIPYEDEGGLEDSRLKDCPAVFAYEDVKTGSIRTTAFCSWQTVKDQVCREIQEFYDQKDGTSRQITGNDSIEEKRSA